MAFIGAGAALSYIIGSIDDGTMQLMSLIIFFVPFFMLPWAFRLAGGLMTTIFSIANDKNKGAFDRLRNYRQGRTKQSFEEMRQGNRFGDSNAVARRFNTLTRGATMANSRNLGYDPTKWRSRMRSTMNSVTGDAAREFAEKSPEFNAMSSDDAKLWASQAKYETRGQIGAALAEADAGRFAGNSESAVSQREQAINEILRARRATNTATFERARVLAQAKTGTGYQTEYTETDEHGNEVKVKRFDVAKMLDDVHTAYGDDASGAQAAIAEMRGSLSKSGQIAGQAGFGDWAGAYAKFIKSDKGAVAREEAQNKVIEGAIKSTTGSYVMHGKPASAATLGEGIRRMFDAANKMEVTTPAEIQAQKDAVELAKTALTNAVNSASMYSSPQNLQAFMNEMSIGGVKTTLGSDAVSLAKFAASVGRRSGHTDDESGPELAGGHHEGTAKLF